MDTLWDAPQGKRFSHQGTSGLDGLRGLGARTGRAWLGRSDRTSASGHPERGHDRVSSRGPLRSGSPESKGDRCVDDASRLGIWEPRRASKCNRLTCRRVAHVESDGRRLAAPKPAGPSRRSDEQRTTRYGGHGQGRVVESRRDAAGTGHSIHPPWKCGTQHGSKEL